MYPTNLIAYAPPLSIAMFLILLHGFSSDYMIMLFVIVAIIISIPLIDAFRITAATNNPLPNIGLMRAHILLHIAPAIYLFSLLFLKVPPIANFIVLGIMLLFFWTGRKLWQALHQAFKSKLYYIFFRGNTSILIVSPILFSLDTFFPSISGGGAFSRLLAFYFSVHFALAGITVQAIKKDSLKATAVNGVW